MGELIIILNVFLVQNMHVVCTSMKTEIDTTESCTLSIMELILQVTSTLLLFKKFYQDKVDKKPTTGQKKMIVPQWCPSPQQ